MKRILTALIATMFILSGCASQGKNQPAVDGSDELDEFEKEFFLEENDPFEKFNRQVFRFNNAVDRAVLRPVARGYRKVMPKPVRRSIRNFLSNLREPWTIINDVLQGKVEQGVKDTARFLFNSTFGVAGLFDFSTMAGLPRHKEDLGQTLAVWGVPEGPFLMLPILGPSSPRDVSAFVVRQALYNQYPLIDDRNLRMWVLVLDYVELRAGLLRLDPILEQQLDPYLFLRDSYRQRRNNEISDGDVLDDEPL